MPDLVPRLAALELGEPALLLLWHARRRRGPDAPSQLDLVFTPIAEDPRVVTLAPNMHRSASRPSSSATC
jgi:hypothetical protein